LLPSREIILEEEGYILGFARECQLLLALPIRSSNFDIQKFKSTSFELEIGATIPHSRAVLVLVRKPPL